MTPKEKGSIAPKKHEQWSGDNIHKNKKKLPESVDVWNEWTRACTYVTTTTLRRYEGSSPPCHDQGEKASCPRCAETHFKRTSNR